MKKLSIIICGCLLLTSCAHLKFVSLPQSGGKCTSDFPVKGNDGNNGWIYHTFDSPYYNKVVAEWCFKDEDAALNFGYRKFKTKRRYR